MLREGGARRVPGHCATPRDSGTSLPRLVLVHRDMHARSSLTLVPSHAVGEQVAVGDDFVPSKACKLHMHMHIPHVRVDVCTLVPSSGAKCALREPRVTPRRSNQGLGNTGWLIIMAGRDADIMMNTIREVNTLIEQERLARQRATVRLALEGHPWA